VKVLIQEIKSATWRLHIDIEDLTIEEWQVIFDELKYNTSVHILESSSKQITMESHTSMIEGNCSTPLTGKIVHDLSELIKLTTTLTMIDFYGNRCVNDEWAVAIANTMKTNQLITRLSMCDGQIGDIGAKAFGKMLIANKHLESLSLVGNHITEDGLIQLANGLKHNTTLTYFNPGYNWFKFNSDANQKVLEARRPGLIITYSCS